MATTAMPPAKVDPSDRESIAALAGRAGREPLKMKHVKEGVDPEAIAQKPQHRTLLARIRFLICSED